MFNALYVVITTNGIYFLTLCIFYQYGTRLFYLNQYNKQVSSRSKVSSWSKVI